ncbi:hypothetical protein NMG60_11030532 [Bertholletia excelsa]
MARIPLLLTLLCFFFAFSNARNSLDLPENHASNIDLSNFLPEIDKELTAKQESEPIVLGEADPQESGKKSLELLPPANEKAGEESTETYTKTVKAVPLERPLTILRFHPINRHVPVNRNYLLRLPRRGCHHGVMKPWGHRREVMYGNDMLIAGDLRENAEHLVRFDHHHHYHHHHHDRDHKTFEEQSLRKLSRHGDEDEEEHEQHEEGGLLKRFREFIDDLF